MSVYIIPIILIVLILYGTYKKVNVYSAFCQGAKSSFDLVKGIFPYIVAIMISVALFRASGLGSLLVNFLTPIFNIFGIPSEVCELVLLKPFTGSGSLSILEDIISRYGADSYISRCACVIMGGSETVFYVSAVYFAGSKQKIAPAIIISLFGGILSAIVGCLLCKIMWAKVQFGTLHFSWLWNF